MGWTTLTKRAIGYLITKANDVDLWIDNIHYLKGQAGDVSMEAGIASDTDITDDLGTSSLRWRNIYGRSIYANRFRATPEIREVRIPWEDTSTFQLSSATAAGGTNAAGGTGQWVLKVDNDIVDSSSRIYQQVEQNGSHNNAWTVTKSPYLRLEFAADLADSRTRIFLGFRATPALDIPTATEIHAGLFWNFGDAGGWTGACSGGAAQASAAVTVSTAARHVLEIWINSASAVEIWLDGTRVANLTTNLPTGSLEWEFNLLGKDGGGAATDTLLTLGQVIIQEAL